MEVAFSLGWALNPLTVNALVNYTGPFRNTTVNPNQSVASYTTVDMSISYRLDGLLHGASIQLRGVNLFDRRPPFYDASAGYFPALASPFGRRVEVTVRFKF